MKKVILPLLLVIFLSQLSYSQSLGVRAGLNISNVSVDGEETVETDSRIAFNLGAVAEFKFNKLFGLETGLIYTSKGNKYEESEEFLGQKYSSEESISLNYLEIPISCLVYYQINSLELNFNAGPYLAYGIGGTIHTEYTAMGQTEKNDEDVEFGSGDDEINPLDYGLNFGIGARYSSFKFGINYELGLSDLTNHEGNTVYNRNIMFTLGYYFDLSSL